MEWYTDPFVKRICKEIDGVDVISAYQMSSGLWGPVNHQLLSNGCKNLILAAKTDKIIYGAKMGGNCASLLLEIAKSKDVTVALTYPMSFGQDFTAHILNDDITTNTEQEFILKYVEFLMD